MTIIKTNGFRWRSKCIILDYDWTIVIPKSNQVFPKDVDDWKWFRKSVPAALASWYKKGYCLIIVTNQSKAWKQQQIECVAKELNLPLLICIAFDKNLYKPNTSILMQAKDDKPINIQKSIFIGDALGRVNDHSDSDLKFAEALGIKVYAPEDFFTTSTSSESLTNTNTETVNTVNTVNTKEIVVMVGLPGSGKTTITKNIFESAGYFVAHGDELKTSQKMIKASEKHILEGKSIVFDSTNPSKEKRMEYIIFARKHNIPIRCIYVSTSFEESLIRNNKREKPIPKIVYNIYKKHFQEPEKEEGFNDITVV